MQSDDGFLIPLQSTSSPRVTSSLNACFSCIDKLSDSFSLGEKPSQHVFKATQTFLRLRKHLRGWLARLFKPTTPNGRSSWLSVRAKPQCSVVHHPVPADGPRQAGLGSLYAHSFSSGLPLEPSRVIEHGVGRVHPAYRLAFPSGRHLVPRSSDAFIWLGSRIVGKRL